MSRWDSVADPPLPTPDQTISTDCHDAHADGLAATSPYATPRHFECFNFVGRVLGKAVGERCVVDMALERTLLCHLLRRRVTLHDMRVGGGGAVDDDQVMNGSRR